MLSIMLNQLLARLLAVGWLLAVGCWENQTAWANRSCLHRSALGYGLLAVGFSQEPTANSQQLAFGSRPLVFPKSQQLTANSLPSQVILEIPLRPDATADPEDMCGDDVGVELHEVAAAGPGVARVGDEAVDLERPGAVDAEGGEIEFDPAGLRVVRIDADYRDDDVRPIRARFAETEYLVIRRAMKLDRHVGLQGRILTTVALECLRERFELATLETRMNEQVKVYGADWCGDTVRALKHLDSRGVKYNYFDIESDTEGETKSLCVPSASEHDQALGK